MLRAQAALGKTLADLGELAGARVQLERGMQLYDTQGRRPSAFHATFDPGVWCLSYGAVVLWMLGYPEQARQRNHEALSLARVRAHPFDLARTLNTAAVLHQCRCEAPDAQARAEEAVALARAQAFPPPVARGMILCGWALAQQGQAEQGLPQMRQGIAALQEMGAELNLPYLLALLAGTCVGMGRRADGMAAVADALAVVERTGMRSCEAELRRLQGEFLLGKAVGHASSPGGPVDASTLAGSETAGVAAAETCFRQALDIARRQQAKSWELRAATSLARLQQQQGKPGEAYALLGPIYGWFTEGFDTADLQEAKTLLEELP
jgi:predicted ATPase